MISIQDLISIIVPVYNTEKYLDQCIQSVMAQTYTNWELLLINDGSTDSSGAICDKYAAEDNRIKVVHKPNTGVSDTKNIALDMTKGEYIMFLDSDDYWSDNTCLVQLLETSRQFDVDIVRGEYLPVDTDGKEFEGHYILASKQKFANQILSVSEFLDKVIRREFFLPLCLFKQSAIQSIRFTSGRIFLEDLEFFIRLLPKVTKCAYIPMPFYAYRKHDSSISSKYEEKKIRDAFDIVLFYFEEAKDAADITLQKSYKSRAITYYILTAKTLGQYSECYRNRHDICERYNLNKIRLKCFKNKRFSEKWYIPFLLYLPPCYLIMFWHIYLKLRKLIKY